MFEKDWKETKKQFYGEQNRWIDEEDGVIDFSPDGMKTVKGGENLSYDEYLDIQHNSLGHQKKSLMSIFVNYDMGYYKGEIVKLTRKNVLFDRLYIDAIRLDGTGYESKESHVWMPKKAFSNFKLYDCVEFDAEVYRYLKTGHGKMIDYGLRNPTNVKKIQPYQLPSDQQLMAQAVDDILWETSLYHDNVDRINWPDVRNEEEYRLKFNQLFTIMTLNDVSWIGIKNLLQIRHGLWCSSSNEIPKDLVRRVTDTEWNYFQPGMVFLLSLY